MTIIEAKEILAKAQLCHMVPVSDQCCSDCKVCKLNVSSKQEQEAFELLYGLMKEVGFHEAGN